MKLILISKGKIKFYCFKVYVETAVCEAFFYKFGISKLNALLKFSNKCWIFSYFIFITLRFTCLNLLAVFHIYLLPKVTVIYKCIV